MLPEGESRFREYIHELRQNPAASRPDLNRQPYSQEFSPRLSIDETRIFRTKMELAEYIDICFTHAGLNREDVLGRNDLWTWLAYIWLDQLAPTRDDGSRDIKEDAKYICSLDYRDYYRHFVAGPYYIYSRHGRENSRIFLYSPVYEHNDFIEQCASRQFIIAYENIVACINRLYFDPRIASPRKGAQSRKRPGNIRRFVKVIQQLELTFDIYDMEPDQILGLLPAEFNEWIIGKQRR